MTAKLDVEKFSTTLAFALNQATLKQMALRPDIKVLNLEDLTIEDIKDYLRSIHSQEWGRRSIIDDELLETAAEWFKGEIDKLYTFIARGKSAGV